MLEAPVAEGDGPLRVIAGGRSLLNAVAIPCSAALTTQGAAICQLLRLAARAARDRRVSQARPQPSSPCLLAGPLVDHLVGRAWTTTPTPRLRGWWPRSSTSGDLLLRPAHPPRARQGERPSNHRPFAPLRA